MAVFVAVYCFHLSMFSKLDMKIKEARLKTFRNGTVNCGNCSAGNRLLKHCKECRESLCDGCVYCHENTKLTREHNLVQIDEFEEELVVCGQKRSVFCRVHEDNVVEQYCRSCEETTCGGCDGHQEHNAVSVAEGCSVEVPNVEEVLEKAIAKVDSHEKCASRYCSIVDELRDRKSELCSRIKAYFVEYREKVKEREDQLLDEVLHWYNMQFELIKNAQKKEERKIDGLTDAVKFSQTLLKHGTDAEILSLKYLIHSHLHRVANQKSGATFITAIEAAIRNASWDTWQEHAQTKSNGLTLPEVQNGSQSDEDDDVEAQNGRNAGQKNWIKLKEIVRKRRRGNSGIDGKDFQLGCVISRENSKIWGGAKENDRQIERDYRYDKILRNRSIGRQGSACGEFQHPCDIAVDCKHDDRLIVTDFNNSRVQVFNYFGKFLFHFGTRGCGPGQFNGPTGVAVLQDGSIVVCDCLNNRVQLFTSRGVFIASFGTEGRGRGQFWRPMGVAVDSEDRIIVADQGNNRVQVFNSNGHFQLTFGKLGNRDGEISCPSFVAVDKDDNIYVSDEISIRIQIFCRDGSYLRQISPKEIHGLPGSVEHLSGIAVDSRGYVIVGVKSACSVRVFTPDGRFLRSFSSTRPCPSRVLFASGISLTSAGEIVVCDWFNNRVRFF